MRAVFVPFGGQTVTFGNLKFLIGYVEITEDTGWADQSLKDLLIRMAAREKLMRTLAVHRTFPHLDSALLMWTSPCRLEASKNSLKGFIVEEAWLRTQVFASEPTSFVTTMS